MNSLDNGDYSRIRTVRASKAEVFAERYSPAKKRKKNTAIHDGNRNPVWQRMWDRKWRWLI